MRSRLKFAGLIVMALGAVFAAPSPAIAADCPCLIDTLAGTGSSLALGDTGVVERRQGQSFVSPGAAVISSFKVRMGANTGSPSGNVSWFLAGDSLGQPGLVIASGSFSVTPSAFNTVTISNGPALNNGGLYWLYFDASPQGSGNFYTINGNSAASTYAGGSNWASDNGGAFAAGSGDLNVVVSLGTLVATSTPTDSPTPGPTPTPSNTPTATITPSPTPDFGIQITATTGAVMKLDRTATFGDTLSFAGSMVVAVILLIPYAVKFWRERIVRSDY